MRTETWKDINDGTERYVEIYHSISELRIKRVGEITERAIGLDSVKRIIGGSPLPHRLTSSYNGGYNVGCVWIPKHVVFAVCKELQVPRPVVK